jgi:hypothetical protein
MNRSFPKRTIELFRAGAMALAVTAAAWVQPAVATVLVIDDLTDNMAVSINGTPITSAGQTVGTYPNTQEVFGFLIQPGSPSNPERAAINFDDYTLPTVGPVREQYLNGTVVLTNPDGSVSDTIIVGYENLGTTFEGTPISQFRVQMESDVDGVPLPGCSSFSNCITVPETGNFQDITAAAFATMSIPFGPLGVPVPEGFTLLVRSELDAPTPGNPVPEPASLALLGMGFAAMSVLRRRKS